MKSLFVLMVSGVVLGGVAEAQTASGGGAGADPGDFYVEGIAQSAFSNVTSQSYGAVLVRFPARPCALCFHAHALIIR